MRFGSTGRGRSQALESKVRFADKPTGTRLLSPTQIIQCLWRFQFSKWHLLMIFLTNVRTRNVRERLIV
jgi:hypothetical protein